MNKIILYYNFDDVYREGPDGFRIKASNFPYEIIVSQNDEKLSIAELYDKYRKKALRAAALGEMCKFVDSLDLNKVE